MEFPNTEKKAIDNMWGLFNFLQYKLLENEKKTSWHLQTPRRKLEIRCAAKYI